MEVKEKILAEKRKKNMRLYTAHRMLTFDLLFYYAIKFLFLTQEKGFLAEEIVTVSALWGIFRVLGQLPITIFIDKVGNKRSLIVADLLHVLSTGMIMGANSFGMLVLANLFGGIAYAMKEVAEPGLLNMSIPEVENKSEIYSKRDGKAVGNYYYLSAISAILSGMLFEVNHYIPMTICMIISLIATFIAKDFATIQKNEKKVDMKEYSKTYLKDLKLAFSFIFNSRRLKALMLYSAIMYGIIIVMGIYEMNLLDEIGMSATATGIVYAIMQLIAGISSKKYNKVHEKYKNKTLMVIGISYTVACLTAGILSVSSLPYVVIIGIIVITYGIRYLDTGFYYVLIKKYITNFTNVEVANKVYSAHEFVIGIGDTLICGFGAIIVAHYNIKQAMIIFGVVFLAIMLVILKYMDTRVGLDPKDYRKKDINYKEYVRLK